jgi:hypothetical protein
MPTRIRLQHTWRLTSHYSCPLTSLNVSVQNTVLTVFIGAFTKLRSATLRIVMSVFVCLFDCLSVRQHGTRLPPDGQTLNNPPPPPPHLINSHSPFNVTVFSSETALMIQVTTHCIGLFHEPTLMRNSLFNNNMFVTLLSSTCFGH